ncbi:HNH endonuclease signature motif containing protein [Actinotalea solisilvae]|uniref:HNH endonuclease signature motif containing protein n=1 Tax=Actinotalea solisilvae TaxID=2072922 RepID=UPI0018F1F6C2|nr:HNH endonuclease signature motif containing protein [Actinotalea solisilvae]
MSGTGGVVHAPRGAGLADLDALLGRLRADAAALAALPLAELEGPRAAAVREGLRVVGDQVHLASSVLLAAVEADGRWAVGGADRTVAGHVARREGIAYGEAARQARLGRAMGELRSTREAVVRGEITRGHAEAIAEVASTAARRAALASDLADRNEAFLVSQARRLGVDEFRRLARRTAAALDERAAEREHADARARRRLVLTLRADGVALAGFLPHEDAAVLTTAVRSVAGVPAAGDDRSAEQRQADALTGVARLALDHGLTGTGAQVRPHLSVLVSWELFERLAAGPDTGAGARPGAGAGGMVAAVGTEHGDALHGPLRVPGELDSGEPLPRSVLERIACDSEVTRVVFGPEGQVLDVGRAQRTYTRQLRRAVIARDRCCAYPGCSAPPQLGEVHHIRWWSQGGPTSVDNGILLCWHHHALVHQHRRRITRVPEGFAFAHTDGRPVAVGRAPIVPLPGAPSDDGGLTAGQPSPHADAPRAGPSNGPIVSNGPSGPSGSSVSSGASRSGPSDGPASATAGARASPTLVDGSAA